MATNYGYAHGQPFGDPSGFTDNTQDWEINNFNQWMRSQPGWAEAQKQGPDSVKQFLQKMGIPVEKDLHIDDAGNVHKGSWWDRHGKQILEGAAIGGLALTGLGAAGIGPLSGVLGGAADAGTIAGSTADETAAALAGGAETTGGLAPELATGIGDLALGQSPELMAGFAPEAATGAVTSGAGEFVGPTLEQMTGTAGVPGSTSIGDLATGAAKGLGKKSISDMLGSVGKGIGDATTAAGQNRLNQENLGLEANQQNISGQSAFENELMARAKLENDQRQQALKDAYRSSYAQSPHADLWGNSSQPQPYSPSYIKGLQNLDTQATSKLASGPQYDTSKMPGLQPYAPVPINNVPGATGTQPTGLEKAGSWVGPAATIASKVPGSVYKSIGDFFGGLF